MSHRNNIIRIKSVYNGLGELKDNVVFVGGATVSLYADMPDQTDLRPTDDIDVLVEIGTYADYTKIQEKLTLLGFQIDYESKIICRYKYQALTVDIMPTDEKILGFSNRWYKEGFANIIRYNIDEYTNVNIFSPSYFIASKLEAFKGRGGNEGRTSQDFEDIVFILDNREKIWQEMLNTEVGLNKYLKQEWRRLLKNRFLEEWLSAHLEYQTAAARARAIISAMTYFVSNKS